MILLHTCTVGRVNMTGMVNMMGMVNKMGMVNMTGMVNITQGWWTWPRDGEHGGGGGNTWNITTTQIIMDLIWLIDYIDKRDDPYAFVLLV